MLQLLQLEILISTWPVKVVSVYKDFNALVNSVQSATWEKKEAGAQGHPYKARNKDSVGGGGGDYNNLLKRFASMPRPAGSRKAAKRQLTQKDYASCN